jgi:hypothetical protein
MHIRTRGLMQREGISNIIDMSIFDKSTKLSLRYYVKFIVDSCVIVICSGLASFEPAGIQALFDLYQPYLDPTCTAAFEVQFALCNFKITPLILTNLFKLIALFTHRQVVHPLPLVCCQNLARPL